MFDNALEFLAALRPVPCRMRDDDDSRAVGKSRSMDAENGLLRIFIPACRSRGTPRLHCVHRTGGTHRRDPGPQRLRPSRYYVTRRPGDHGQRSRLLRFWAGNDYPKGRLQPNGPSRVRCITRGPHRVRWGLKKQGSTEHPYQSGSTGTSAAGRFARPPHFTNPDHQTCSSASRRSATRSRTCGLFRPMASERGCSAWLDGPYAPLACSLDQSYALPNYFKQLFAQVPTRRLIHPEEIITSSWKTMLGSEGNLLQPTPEAAA